MFCWNVEPAPLTVPVAQDEDDLALPAALTDDDMLTSWLLVAAAGVDPGDVLSFVPHAATASSPATASAATAAVREVLTK